MKKHHIRRLSLCTVSLVVKHTAPRIQSRFQPSHLPGTSEYLMNFMPEISAVKWQMSFTENLVEPSSASTFLILLFPRHQTCLTHATVGIESLIVSNRIKKLRRLLAKKNLDGLVISNLNNIRYLCGYTGSNGMMLITPKSAWFYTDFRYQEAIRTQVKGCHKQIRNNDLYAKFPVEHTVGIKKLGLEKNHITIARFQAIKRQLKGVKLVPVQNLVIELRRTKEPGEIKLIQRAQSITDRVLRELLRLVKPGVRERELAAEITYQFGLYGENAFSPIVASGPNGGCPHAQPSDRKFRKGDAITFDMGSRYEGYCSDMTRTVFLGKPDNDLRQVYNIVLEAQKRGLAAVKPGAACAAVDQISRGYIRNAGYGPYFGHALGHGVGLAVHEAPALSYRSKAILKPNDVVTVEPGIYLPEFGGVRIEDMVLVTRDGFKSFTRSPKRIIEL